MKPKTNLPLSATHLLLRRFKRDTRGSNAVEFGVLAMPFFGLLIAIFETAMIFLGQQAAEIATLDAARLVRTGQAQNFSVAQFRTAICAQLSAVVGCSDINIDVRTFPDFGAIDSSLDDLLQQQALGNDPLKFEVGGPSSIVMVRVYAVLPSLTSGLGLGQGHAPGGGHVIASTAIFRNEPYPNNGA